MMMLTLPKPIDDTILLMDSHLSDSGAPALSWTTPREFIEHAASRGVKAGVYVPQLFKCIAGATTTSDALTPNALAWSINLMRQLGHDIKMFDSLYDAGRWVKSAGPLSINSTEKEAILFYIGQALTIAKTEERFAEDDEWERGLFADFDFYIASGIFFKHYGTSIIDVMTALGCTSKDFKAAYAAICEREDMSPSVFVNESRDKLGLVDILSGEQFFLSKNKARDFDITDEYASLIAMMERESDVAKATFLPAEFERRFLNLNFATGSDLLSESDSRGNHA